MAVAPSRIRDDMALVLAYSSQKEESSFSEEKEAKRLLSDGAAFSRAERIKVFWFFFSKKNMLTYLPG
jgi:hypothetical protein